MLESLEPLQMPHLDDYIVLSIEQIACPCMGRKTPNSLSSPQGRALTRRSMSFWLANYEKTHAADIAQVAVPQRYIATFPVEQDEDPDSFLYKEELVPERHRAQTVESTHLPATEQWLNFTLAIVGRISGNLYDPKREIEWNERKCRTAYYFLRRDLAL